MNYIRRLIWIRRTSFVNRIVESFVVRPICIAQVNGFAIAFPGVKFERLWCFLATKSYRWSATGSMARATNNRSVKASVAEMF